MQQTDVLGWFREKFAPFVDAQGLEILDAAPGEFVVRLPQAAPGQRGGGGTDALNGGVMAYMFDGALGGAIASAALSRMDLSQIDPTQISQATVNLNISYLRPALGDSFEAHGTATKVGRSMGFAEGKLYDEQGGLCATATGVWMLFLPDGD